MENFTCLMMITEDPHVMDQMNAPSMDPLPSVDNQSSMDQQLPSMDTLSYTNLSAVPYAQVVKVDQYLNHYEDISHVNSNNDVDLNRLMTEPMNEEQQELGYNQYIVIQDESSLNEYDPHKFEIQVLQPQTEGDGDQVVAVQNTFNHNVHLKPSSPISMLCNSEDDVLMHYFATSSKDPNAFDHGFRVNTYLNPPEITDIICTRPYCGYRSNRSNNMKRHNDVLHTDKSSLSCCGVTTKQGSLMDLHKELQHNVDNSFIHPDRTKRVYAYFCPECGRKFPHKASMDRHVGSVHSKTVKHRCDLCDYGSNHQSNLKRHLATKHSGASKGRKKKPHNCTYRLERPDTSCHTHHESSSVVYYLQPIAGTSRQGQLLHSVDGNSECCTSSSAQFGGSSSEQIVSGQMQLDPVNSMQFGQYAFQGKEQAFMMQQQQQLGQLSLRRFLKEGAEDQTLSSTACEDEDEEGKMVFEFKHDDDEETEDAMISYFDEDLKDAAALMTFGQHTKTEIV